MLTLRKILQHSRIVDSTLRSLCRRNTRALPSEVEWRSIQAENSSRSSGYESIQDTQEGSITTARMASSPDLLPRDSCTTQQTNPGHRTVKLKKSATSVTNAKIPLRLRIAKPRILPAAAPPP